MYNIQHADGSPYLEGKKGNSIYDSGIENKYTSPSRQGKDDIDLETEQMLQRFKV